MELQIKIRGDLAENGVDRNRSLGMFGFSLQMDFEASSIHGLTLAWALSITFLGSKIRDVFGFPDTERNAIDNDMQCLSFFHAECRKSTGKPKDYHSFQ